MGTPAREGHSNTPVPYVRAVVGGTIPHVADVGVAWVWLIIFLHATKKVMVNFRHGHRVTGSQTVFNTVWSRGHGQFLDSHSSKYSAYWSDHPLTCNSRPYMDMLYWTSS